MEIYRFSPILNKEKLIEAVKYVAIQTSLLSKQILGKELPINSLTIFSHYPEEYETLVNILESMGKIYNENNGPIIILKEPIKVEENSIKYLRIRKPDPYRMQVRCNDFEVKDYNGFKESYSPEKSPNMRVIRRIKYEMIEFFHPDFDVLAYVVSK